MKLLKNFRTLLIATFAVSCAGKPPEMDRPVTFYYGNASRQEMCQAQQRRIVAWLQKMAKHSTTRKYIPQYAKAMLARDSGACIAANDQRFEQLVGMSVDDLGALLQYQEDLIYKCERWKQ